MNTVIKTICAVILTNILLPNVSFAEGDALAGADTFKKKCVICHTVEKDGKAKIGPNLFGIYNTKAGEADGYNYSKGLIEANLTWDDATLDAYLLKPRDVVNKGKMIFVGFKKEQDRQDVIAYLKTLKE
ncbi:MAG: cytochrome c family protein [Proteobacteria bacterium]|jgi:cytochrome c|nr:cytochrome c family protein [Pseudomonadota bacterium]